MKPFRNGSDLPRVTAKLTITYNHLAFRPRAVNYAGTSASIIHNQPPLTLRDRERNLYLLVVNDDYVVFFFFFFRKIASSGRIEIHLFKDYNKTYPIFFLISPIPQN